MRNNGIVLGFLFWLLRESPLSPTRCGGYPRERAGGKRIPKVIAVLPLVAVPTGVLAQPAMTERVEVPSIVVTGEGKVNITPDIARITVGVQTSDRDSAKAVNANAALMSKIMQVLGAFGIPAKDIQTVNYNVYPMQRPPQKEGETERIVGYNVTNQVQVTVRKIGDVGRVIDGVTQAGANVAGGILFDANEDVKASAYEDALAKAVAEANRKAKALARAARVSTYRLVTISEGGPIYDNPRPMYAMAARAESFNTPVSAGEQSVRANVSVRYVFEAPVAQTTND